MKSKATLYYIQEAMLLLLLVEQITSLKITCP